MLRLALALTLAAAFDFVPRLAGLGYGVADVPGLLAALDGEKARAHDLEGEHASSRRRYAERARLIEDVIAGRRTLHAAASALRALFADAPSGERNEYRRLYPAASEEECYCRAVIGHVAVALEDRPEVAGSVMARLESELRELMADGRPPRLAPAGAGRPGLVLTDLPPAPPGQSL
jgi:hypothetical protein